MPDVDAHRDDCRTYADVMAKSARVHEFRASLAPPPVRREPQIVYRLKEVEPPLQVMFERVAESYGLTSAVLANAIYEARRDAAETATSPKKIRLHDIQRWVAHRAGISKQDMLSQRRQLVIVKPRQIAMLLAKRLTERSYPEIGRMFGGRDHTTVLHAVRKLTPLLEYVEQIIRPQAELSEWISLMFLHYDRFIH